MDCYHNRRRPPEALELLITRAHTAAELSRRVVQAAQWMGSRDNGTVACLHMPLGVLPTTIERSVRLVDPWGELQLLNSIDNRQSPSVGGAPASNANRSVVPDSEPISAEKVRQNRQQSRKRRGSKSQVTRPMLLPDETSEKPTQSVEITEIREQTLEGEK
jgi:hypothetical protein